MRGGCPPPSSVRSVAVLLPGRAVAARLRRCGGTTGPTSSRGGDPPPSGVAGLALARAEGQGRERGSGTGRCEREQGENGGAANRIWAIKMDTTAGRPRAVGSFFNTPDGPNVKPNRDTHVTESASPGSLDID